MSLCFYDLFFSQSFKKKIILAVRKVFFFYWIYIMVGLCPFIFTPYFSIIKKNVYLLSEKRLKTGETAVQGVHDMDVLKLVGIIF
jgi:hypothetical protein